jgi:hypothetical protein
MGMKKRGHSFIKVNNKKKYVKEKDITKMRVYIINNLSICVYIYVYTIFIYSKSQSKHNMEYLY